MRYLLALALVPATLLASDDNSLNQVMSVMWQQKQTETRDEIVDTWCKTLKSSSQLRCKLVMTDLLDNYADISVKAYIAKQEAK